MADVKPSTWLGAGYSYASDAITMGTAANANPTLAELTAAEANATTGNINNILWAFLKKMHDEYVDQVAASNTPASFSIYRSTSVNDTTGVTTTTFTVVLTGTGSFTPNIT